MNPGTIRRLTIAALLLMTAGLVCAAASGIDPNALLSLAPAFLLCGVLLARRYPGETHLLRLRRTRRPHSRPHRACSLEPPPRTRILGVPRGGLLLGRALAVRPPPPALALS